MKPPKHPAAKSEQQPKSTLLFMLAVAAALVGIAAMAPSSSINLPFGLVLRLPTTDRLLNYSEPEYADISEAILLADSVEVILEDTIKSEGFTPTPQPRLINVDSLLAEEDRVMRIQFKDDAATALGAFFKALDAVWMGQRSCQIFHYGDSQIEGDRMTSFIRERLQKRFGGIGPGMVPLANANVIPAFQHECSENWIRCAVFGKDKGSCATMNYGAMGSVSVFTPHRIDSTQKSTDTAHAFVRFNTASTPYPRAKKFESATLYYGPTESPVHATAALGDSAFSVRLTGSNPVNAITWNTSTPTSELSLNFSAKESPLFYGISLAQRQGGVLVHNIAMRGGSGTVFHQIDRDALREMYKQCHTGLIIMQFGGNVMPYIEDEQACVDYGRWFYNQLMILKGACPGASIIVIGPSDMSIKTEDYYQTYPLLENVRDALRDAALKAGAGFWDMYEAMGGKNSMPSWVVANPPLAATDYTHFSPRGARTIAEMFYKSLILEYDKHLSQKAPKS